MIDRPDLIRIGVPLLIAAGTTAVLLIVRAAVYRLLVRWSAKTETMLDDILLGSIHKASMLWAVAIGLHTGVDFSDMNERYVSRIGTVIEIIVILSVTVAGANLAGKLYRNYLQKTGLALPATGLGYGIVVGTVYVIGGLIVLSVLGITIAPIITALGVGGLAVALALQDTLSNLFAGMHILLEKSIRVGDFVRLESGQEGYVQDITWRTTRVRLLSNNMVVLPNNKVAQSTLTNYSLPEKKMALTIPVSVAYGTALERVERILVEEATAAIAVVPGLLAEPAPFVQFIPGFGESSMNFTLVCHVAEFVEQYPVQHEIRKRIVARFAAEGIEIPYPQRTVHLRGDGGKSAV